MPYRFRLQEDLSDGVRRIIGEQLTRAVDGFRNSDPDPAIHKARRRLKKARSILHLIKPGISEKCFRKWNADLRDVGMLFSSERDVFVISNVVRNLSDHAPVRAKAALKAAQSLIDQTKVDQKPEVRDAMIAAGASRLREAIQDLPKLQCDNLKIDDLARGMSDGLRDCRTNFARAYEIENDETFHEWRKSVQRHWRQCLLLETAWFDFFAARAAVAEKLATLLGADHDLAILKHFIAAHIDKGMTAKQAETLFAIAQDKQDKYRDQAKLIGEALNAASPKRLARELVIYWEAAAAMKSGAPERLSRFGLAVRIEPPKTPIETEANTLESNIVPIKPA